VTRILTILFLFALCLTVRAQTIPMPSGAYQTAVVQKQATIQMQSAAASVQVVTNFTWLCDDTSTNATGTILKMVDDYTGLTNLFSGSYTGTNGTVYATSLPQAAVTNDQWTGWMCVTNTTEVSPWSLPYYYPPMATNAVFTLSSGATILFTSNCPNLTMPGGEQFYRTSNGVLLASIDLKHWANTAYGVTPNFNGNLTLTKTLQYAP
jgi:hypothetical protein